MVTVVLFQEHRKLCAAPSRTNRPRPTPTPRNVITSALNTTKQRTQAIQRVIISAFPSRKIQSKGVATNHTAQTNTMTEKLPGIVRPTPANRNQKQTNRNSTGGIKLSRWISTPTQLCSNIQVQPVKTGAQPSTGDNLQGRPSIYRETPEHGQKLEWWEQDENTEDEWSMNSDVCKEVREDECNMNYVNTVYSTAGLEYKEQDLDSQFSDCTYDDISSMVEDEIFNMKENNETKLHSETIQSSLNNVYNSYINKYSDDTTLKFPDIPTANSHTESMRDDNSIVLSVHKLDTNHSSTIQRSTGSIYNQT